MSTLIGLRPTSRSAKLGVGVKDVVTGKVTWVNLDNPRVARDYARHATLGQWVQVGSPRYQQDTAQVGSGGLVTPRTGSLTLDISAGNLAYVAGNDAVYTKGATASWAALTQAVTPNATLPIAVAIGLDTSTPGTPTAVALAGATPSAITTEERFINSSSTLPAAQLPALDQTANRTWLALVWVAPALAITSVAATDVFTSTGGNHGYKVGDPVWFSALTGGAGLTANQLYYVNTVPSATTFTVSATLGGATFDHTTNITASTANRQILAADVQDIRP